MGASDLPILTVAVARSAAMLTIIENIANLELKVTDGTSIYRWPTPPSMRKHIENYDINYFIGKTLAVEGYSFRTRWEIK